MGVLPLQLEPGQSAASLGLSGHETYTVTGLGPLNSGEVPKQVAVSADGAEFNAKPRIDTPMEAAYYRHGGILHYVLRGLVQKEPAA
jgi:aconitate hydratase